MQVSVEALKGLERKVTISVASDIIKKQVNDRLQRLQQTANFPGFRPGKAPFSKVEARYLPGVLEEVAQEQVNSTLFEALKENNLVPAGMPKVEPEQLETDKDFRYSAIFEVFPEFKIKEFSQDKIELIEAEVSDSDVQELLTKLREENKNWEDVDRPIKKGDKLIIDFAGYLDDKPFQGGKAKDYELIIGSNVMIPGFEDAIIGGKKGEPFDINVTFPEDYSNSELSGKNARFNITAHNIQEGKLPELDEDFAKLFNINEGGIEALTADLKENMINQLEQKVSLTNRDRVFDKILELNPFELPTSLIEKEIEQLKHEMFHRIYGPEHHENEKIPDFPRQLFEEQAKRRVHLGLFFAEYVKTHKVVADRERVEAMIDKLSSTYENPEELRSMYKSNKKIYAEIEALVTEEMITEKLSESATITKKKVSYQEAMNPQPVKSNGENKS